MTRDPFPSVIVIIAPATIVKGGPSPGIIRHPGITIICHYPMPACGIRPKSVFGIRDPNITIGRVINPGTIGIKFVIELLVRYIFSLLCPDFIWSGEHY
jgi:hypothetical protein